MEGGVLLVVFSVKAKTKEDLVDFGSGCTGADAGGSRYNV